MKRIVTALAVIALVTVAVPASAQYRQHRYGGGDNALRIHAGLFTPDGDSEYWDGTFLDFTGDADDFEDVTIGFDYVRRLQGNLKLVVSGTAFEGEADQAYLDFVDTFGNDIFHTTTLQVTSATLGLAIDLAPRNAPLVPYLGAGGGLYAWDLEESGEFIDFLTDPPEIFPATFQDDGVVFGWYWMAGLDVPVGNTWSVFFQGRWHYAEDDLEADFVDLGKLDLGGREITAGFSWSF